MLIFVHSSSGNSFSCRRAETGIRSVVACVSMRDAKLWTEETEEKYTFLIQPVIQNVLKELGETRPAQVCDDLLLTVRKRLRTID